MAVFKQHFDYVIVNAPPMLISNDALLLGHMCDAGVLALKWGKTHRRTAKICAERLDQAACQIIGGVLTNVDLRKFELYEYGHAGACTSTVDDCYEN